MWTSATAKELVEFLYEKYDAFHKHATDGNILALIINDEDVTTTYANIRSSLTIPDNITAESLVLLNKYLTDQTILPYYANFHTFAVDLIESSMEYHKRERVQWSNQNDKVIIIDYDLNERAYQGEAYLCTYKVDVTAVSS
jgi:hypothetical protein